AVTEHVRHRAGQLARVLPVASRVVRDVAGYAAHRVAPASKVSYVASVSESARSGLNSPVTRSRPAAPISRQRARGSASARASASQSGPPRPVGTSQPVSPGATIPSRLAAWLRMAGSPDALASSATFGSP